MRPLLGVGILALLLPLGPAAAAEEDDTVTILSLGATRPVLVRIHVRSGGESYCAPWDRLVSTLMTYLDVDQNGILDQNEAARAPTVGFLRSQMSGAIGFFGNSPQASFKDLDKNKDGKIALEELKAYYRGQGFGPLQLRGMPGQGRSSLLTEALMRTLGSKTDTLAQKQIETASIVLPRFDTDEDEYLTAEELLSDPGPSGIRFGSSLGAFSQIPATAPFVFCQPGDTFEKAAETLVTRYSRNPKEGGVTRQEIGFDEGLFSKLDKNHDGKLQAPELIAWIRSPSDLEMAIPFGEATPPVAKPAVGGLLASLVGQSRQNPGGTPIRVHPTPETKWPLSDRVKSDYSGGLSLTQEINVLEFRVAPPFGGRVTGLRPFYINQFQMLVKSKGRDYILLNESDPYFRGMFPFADRNGDGKLYETELQGVLNIIGQATEAFITLSLADYGAGLFELFDANRDGRLSLRELKTSWSRVAPWAKTQANAISTKEIPARFQFTLGHGPGQEAAPPQARMMTNPTPSTGGVGPVWFRKMDRNGDGDISPREWLGSEEDFRKLDRNSDGLLSMDEAEALSK